MLTAEQLNGFDSPRARPANDTIGAHAAYDLWTLVDPILNCADFSEDRERYETSLFRFPAEHRQLFAALSYLAIVERGGHAAYFGSTHSYGFDDAMACFTRIGARQVVDVMRAAATAEVMLHSYASGPAADAGTDYHAHDNALVSCNPLRHLQSYARRFGRSFDRW